MRQSGEHYKTGLPQRTFDFSATVVRFCMGIERKSQVPKELVGQLVRSATSIGANVEEDQASQSEADFLSKYNIACKEARETHYWLRLFAGTKLADLNTLEPLINEANELIAILTAIGKKMRMKLGK